VTAFVLAALAAWQSFAPGPFRTQFSGHIRATWAKDVPEPTWVADTFAGLALKSYDGKTLVGEVELWAAMGLDVKQCVAEVVYDVRGKRGIRTGRPSRIEPGAPGGAHAFWAFTAEVEPSLPILSASAYVFCPIDAAHVNPPWGATFSTIESVMAGPKGKAQYCAKLGTPSVKLGVSELSGHQTYDVGFACGVLPRLRKRELVDECTGDVLFSLDALGAHTTASASPSGTPLDDEELRKYFGGSGECDRIQLSGFDKDVERAWQAAVKRMGQRMLFGFSRDGMIQP
jgi:hypothetical protein